MKVLSKLILLMGMVVALSVSPSFADGKGKSEMMNKEVITVSSSDSSQLAEEFYFPAFDASLEAFWLAMEPMHNSCEANSWLGGTASATCLNRQNCICTSSFIYVECHCE